ncbi:MAG: hypothetical protein J6X28_00360, partial [Bacilli bacterium]|nr:hypothetical protein [Bacilli bacterium]
MAKLEFKEDKINTALDSLQLAKTSLGNLESAMTSAVGIITGARGANYISSYSGKLSSTLQTPSLCIEQVDAMITDINDKLAEVKKYNEEYENMSWAQKLFSSIGMAFTKFTEGFFTAGEQIIDGFAGVLGAVVGLVSPSAKEAIGDFIKKDYVGDFYDSLYNNELKGMVQGSVFKEDGLVSKGFEILGTAVGYGVAISTGGGIAGQLFGYGAGAATTTAGMTAFQAGATAASHTLAVSAAAAGIGGLGGTMEAGLGAGMTYDDAFKLGVENGLKSAATVVAVNYAIRGVSHLISKARGAGSGGAGSAGGAGGSGGSGGGGTGGSGGTGGGAGSKAAETFGDMGDDLGGMGDDFGNAAAGGNGPTGGGTGGAGSGATGGATGGSGASGSGIRGLSPEGASHLGDSFDDIVEAAKSGKISYDDAIKIAEENFKNAAARADKVKWHPDKMMGELHGLQEAIKASGGTTANPFNLADAVDAVGAAAAPVAAPAVGNAAAGVGDDLLGGLGRATAETGDDVLRAAAGVSDDVSGAAIQVEGVQPLYAPPPAPEVITVEAVSGVGDDLLGAAAIPAGSGSTALTVVGGSADEIANVVSGAGDDIANAVGNISDDLAAVAGGGGSNLPAVIGGGADDAANALA